MVCQFCAQEMMNKVGCHLHGVYDADGTAVECTTEHMGEPDGFCHDCWAPHGTFHHPGCDAERCPICNGQLISCEHSGDEDWEEE